MEYEIRLYKFPNGTGQWEIWECIGVALSLTVITVEDFLKGEVILATVLRWAVD